MAKRTQIRVDGLTDAINDVTQLYHKNVIGGVKEKTREHMKNLVKETKAQRYKRDTSRFRRAISSRVKNESDRYLIMQWYVKAPHYRLTHLLEDGHLTPRGNKTVAYKFVEKAADKVSSEYLAEVQEVLSRGE